MAQLHEGHRKRLLERFENQGLAGLHDYEIIELLLTFAIPRKDTKPIAKKLLDRYKTISALLNAPAAELAQIPGIGGRAVLFMALVREISSYCLREKFARQSIVQQRSDVEQYLRFHFGMRRDEYVAALYLDTGNRCIATEIVAEGTVNQCAIYPRTIIHRGFTHGAAGIVLVHNHPGGRTEPSRADWQLTERVFAAAKLLDIPLIDHLIITHDAIISLRDFARWPGK